MHPTRLLAAAAATAFTLAQEPSRWIYLDSTETRQPPRLLLTLADDSQRVVTATVDTVLIEYLGDRAFAALPGLAIDMADRNHSLLRFPLPAGIEVKRAEMLATAHASPMPPRGDTTVRVHRVAAAWNDQTCWRTAPRFEAGEVAVLKVPFGGGEVGVDLTATVQAWLRQPAQNFGVLLRGLQDDGPAKAPAGAAPTAPAGANPQLQQYHRQQQLNDRLVHCLPWQTTAGAALQEAGRTGKLVFTFVIADVGPLGNAHERALAVTALLDADVRRLLLQHFVPLRLQTHAQVHLGRQPGAEDPLAPLGTDSVRAKAPALLVSRPDGQLVAELASIGTWSRQLVVGLLLQALATAAVDVGDAGPDRLVRQLRQASLCGDSQAAVQAARELGDATARLVLLRKDLLDGAEADGTWVDCEENGKTYATAMALLVLLTRP